MDVKRVLKSFKLNESAISIILGVLVLVVVAILIFNYFKGLRNAQILPPITTEADQVTIMRDGKTFHVVQPGDTLWGVAERYYDSGYNWVDIASANTLSNANIISEGQELEIPIVEPEVATVTIDQTKSEAMKTTVYTVLMGDTLWSIATDAYGDGFRWVDIAKANNLVNPQIIHAGNQLQLP